MLIFETKLKFNQYFLSILGAFHIIPVAIIFAFGNNKDKGIYFFLLLSILIGLIQFMYTLKSFHLYNDHLTIKRPYLFFDKISNFKKSEIEKITFKKNSSNIAGGIYACVKTKNIEKSFMLIYERKVLSNLILKLNEVGIKTDIQINL